MNRIIKFRAWDKKGKRWADHNELLGVVPVSATILPTSTMELKEDDYWIFVQFTGLLDKNAGQEVYDGDIIDSDGNIKGNTYEMDAGETDLVIEGFGTKTWAKTEMAGLGRGLRYAE